MSAPTRVNTGIPGLDHVLGGGLPVGDALLLKGEPGTGKTTIGLQFLVEGARRGERCLHVCLAETRGQLAAMAESYGLALEGIDIHEMRHLVGSGGGLGYSVFPPSEVELEEVLQELYDTVDRAQPQRMVLDSLSQIRLLSDDPARYRRQVLALADRLARHGCTTLLLDVASAGPHSVVADTLVSGVVHLEHLSPVYGGDRRRLSVRKLRASPSVGGFHDFKVGSKGVEVFPRLVAATYRAPHHTEPLSSGVAGLDALLGGGLDSGTSTILLGPTGTGKSTVAASFASAAARRGERAAIFMFDESPMNLLRRCTALGLPLADQVSAGSVHLRPVDPAEFTPGELAHLIRQQVEAGARVVVLDSVNGYTTALPEERFLTAHLHELLAFLSEEGVLTLLTVAERGAGGAPENALDISNVADALLIFRHVDVEGERRNLVSVAKKRTGDHVRTSRVLDMGPEGLVLREVGGTA